MAMVDMYLNEVIVQRFLTASAIRILCKINCMILTEYKEFLQSITLLSPFIFSFFVPLSSSLLFLSLSLSLSLPLFLFLPSSLPFSSTLQLCKLNLDIFILQCRTNHLLSFFPVLNTTKYFSIFWRRKGKKTKNC